MIFSTENYENDVFLFLKRVLIDLKHNKYISICFFKSIAISVMI